MISLAFVSLQMDSANVNTRIVLAQQYLEDQVSGAISDTYALCIISYALALARSSKVGHVLQLLEGLAKVEGKQMSELLIQF